MPISFYVVIIICFYACSKQHALHGVGKQADSLHPIKGNQCGARSSTSSTSNNAISTGKRSGTLNFVEEDDVVRTFNGDTLIRITGQKHFSSHLSNRSGIVRRPFQLVKESDFLSVVNVFGDDLIEASERMNKVEDQVKELKEQVKELKGQVKELKGLKEQVKELKGQVKELKKPCPGLKEYEGLLSSSKKDKEGLLGNEGKFSVTKACSSSSSVEEISIEMQMKLFIS